MNHPSCPLCREAEPITELKSAMPRRYLACGNCHLAFMHPDDYLDAEAEKAYYATHDNNIEDDGYVSFLSLLLDPLIAILRQQLSADERKLHDFRALDYGCGPGPTLSTLIERTGIPCDNYDPFFFRSELKNSYDIITSTECFEHFHAPEKELERLTSLLNKNGLLAIMTSRWTTPEKFMHWHYNRDPTHVVFMHESTIGFIEEKFGLSCIYRDEKRIAIFSKSL